MINEKKRESKAQAYCDDLNLIGDDERLPALATFRAGWDNAAAENEQEIARLREALEDEKEDVKKYILLALERKRENDKLRDLLQTWVNLESDPHRMPEVSKVFNDSIQALEQ